MSDEALLKQVYQDTHFAADMTEKCYDGTGRPLAMPVEEAAEFFRRIRRSLETALGATRELETRAIEQRKEKTNAG